MRRERLPVFLARRTYGRRRIADAARLLPIAGAALLCLPLLWRGTEAGESVWVMFYVFGLWVILIALSALITRKLDSDGSHRDDPHATTEEEDRAG